MLPTPFLLSSDQRQKRSLTQDVTAFVKNHHFQYTNLLSFDSEARSIHTIPSIREHCGSYLYYFQYKILETVTSQAPFQIIFNPVQGINTRTFYMTIHPQNKI